MIGRRVRNLALFGLAALLVLGGLGLAFRGAIIGRLFGVNFDVGPGGQATLTVPDGYQGSVFAGPLDGPRFMDVSPDGVLFVAERGADRIVALPDRDGDDLADEIVEVGRGYGDAHDIEFADDGKLLVAGESTLWAVAVDHRLLAEQERRAVAQGLPAGGRHTTRTVAILPSGDMLLSIGSSCDVCIEEDERRGAISLIQGDGTQRIHMRGLRNAVGVWVDDETGRAWATNMGRDLLGDDRPPETVYEVVGGADAGWPRCHAGSIPDPDFGTDADACEGVAQPTLTLPAHVAPLALVEWEDHLVIALHGSWNSSTKVGYKLVWLPWDGEPAGPVEDLATGFLPEGAADALGRPAGLAVGADGALYVSDDKAGYIYRIAAP
ncbi:MAG: PQQ-dependent sugar dehydrogenase [Candidatus Limnocylindria bacterium]